MAGHIAGAPIEETAIALAPLATVARILIAARVRDLFGSMPHHTRRRRPEGTA